jgi:two-component system cell cycle sensor histidine kinase/response regulator CckA
VNARDAMPTGGQLRVATESVDVDEAFAREHAPMTPGRYVRLTVGDTGVGMPRETLAKIFEPFFTTKPVGKGTGLGLATVYGIVQQSGGFIWVDSTIGRGTAFVIDFPAVDAPLDPTLPAPTTERLVNGSETVLLVEDEGALRRLVKQALSAHGYTVLEGRDGNHGLEVAQQHRGPIRLLVTDVVMPGISGPDLVSRLLSTRPEMRVLYMSGYLDRDHVAALGTAPLLTKPFLPGTLLRFVRDVLDAPSAS